MISTCYRLKTLLVLLLVLGVNGCSAGLEKHIATVEAEDVSGIEERQPEMIGGIAALYSTLYYPKSAREEGIEGRVMVRYTVTEQGLPENVEVERSSGDHQLDRSAVSTVEKMRFIPGVIDGERASMAMTVPVIYRL